MHAFKLIGQHVEETPELLHAKNLLRNLGASMVRRHLERLRSITAGSSRHTIVIMTEALLDGVRDEFETYVLS